MAAAAGEVKKGVDAGEVKKLTQGDWVMKAMLGAVKENLTDEKNDVNENLTEKNDVNASARTSLPRGSHFSTGSTLSATLQPVAERRRDTCVT
jgi:hypothetical protein